jgi:hypothetical protein
MRETTNRRLWDALCGLLSDEQRARLDQLLEVEPGSWVLVLNRLRHSPIRISGPEMTAALRGARQIANLGIGEINVRDEDDAHLSPFIPVHINMLGKYAFQLLNDIPGELRPLHEQDA